MKRLMVILALFSTGLLNTALAATDVLIASIIDSPDPVPRNASVTYTIDYENADTGVAADVVIEMTIPDNTSFVGTSYDAASSINPNCTYDDPTRKVTCNIGALEGVISPATGSRQEMKLIVQTNPTTPSPLTFQASISTSSTEFSTENNTSNVITTTVSYGANLKPTKTVTPDTVNAGENVIWQIEVENQGPNIAPTVHLEDTLPPSVSYVGFSGDNWTCNANGSNVDCDYNALVLNGGTTSILSIETKVTGALSGSAKNVVKVDGRTDPDPTDNSASATLTVNPGADLKITKTAPTPNPVPSNAEAVFILAPRNLGPSDILAADGYTVTVTDTIPPNFSFVSAVGNDWSCSYATGIVSCARVGDFLVGDADNITVTLQAGSEGNTIVRTNTSNITSTMADSDLSNNQSEVSFEVLPNGVNVSINKFKSPSPVAEGDIITSSIRVHNHGPRVATAGTISVIDTIVPADEQYLNYSGNGWTCTPTPMPEETVTTISCVHNRDVAVDTNAPALTIRTIAQRQADMIKNTATVYYSGSPGDWYIDDNTIEAHVPGTSTNNSIDLVLSKSTTTANGDDIVDDNEDYVTYVVELTNKGPADGTEITFTDEIPAFLSGKTTVSTTYSANGSSAVFSCVDGSTVTCTQTSGVLAANDSVTFSIRVNRDMLDGQYVNIASAYSDAEGDLDRTDNEATAAVTIVPIADVEVQSKTVTPVGPLAAQIPATYVVSIRNNGPSTAEDVVVSDILSSSLGVADGGFVIRSVRLSKGSCLLDRSPIRFDEIFYFPAPEMICDMGSMSVGEVQTITVEIGSLYMPSEPDNREFINRAAISTSTAESTDGSDGGNNTKEVALKIEGGDADLLISINDGSGNGPDPLGFNPTPSEPEDNIIVYDVRVANSSGGTAAFIEYYMTMTPPDGKTITFLGASTSKGAAAINDIDRTLCDDDNVSATGPDKIVTRCDLYTGQSEFSLQNGEEEHNYLVFRVDSLPESSGDHYNIGVRVNSNIPDMSPDNNTAFESTTVKALVDLELFKTARKSIDITDSQELISLENPANALTKVQRREPFLYVIKVKNNGPLDSNITLLEDILPDGVDYLSNAFDDFNILNPPYNQEPYLSGATWAVPNDPVRRGTCDFDGEEKIISCDMGQLNVDEEIVVIIPAITEYGSRIPNFTNCASVMGDGVDNVHTNDDPEVENASDNLCTEMTITESSVQGKVSLLRTDVPLEGVRISIQGSTEAGEKGSFTEYTDASGQYEFLHLPMSDETGYTVIEVQPQDYLDGPEEAGSVGGEPFDIAGGRASAIAEIVLPADTDATGYNFKELGFASISGFVYEDLNNDGNKDTSEAGIAGVTISISGTSYGSDGVEGGGDDVVISPALPDVVTDANGAYLFENLAPGNYTVTIQSHTEAPLLNNYVPGKRTTGSTDDVECSGVCEIEGSDDIVDISLSSSSIAKDMNFAELEPRTLSGSVYLYRGPDADNPLDYDPSRDDPIAGVVITLTGVDKYGNNVGPLTAITDANGNYIFEGLANGTYRLEETQPTSDNYISLSPSATAGTADGNVTAENVIEDILLEDPASGYVFGETFPILIAGNVFRDDNNNGIQDVGERGISGVWITLSGDANATTQTDSDGHYRFNGLNDGTYNVKIQSHDRGSALNGYAPGKRGEEANIDTVPCGAGECVPSFDAISNIVLTGTDHGLKMNFAEIIESSLAGYVYDFLGDQATGVPSYDPTRDKGIAKVELTLTWVDDFGATQEKTALTDDTGYYIFAGLAPNSAYLLVEKQPSGYQHLSQIAGSAGGDDATVDDEISGIALNQGDNAIDYFFAELRRAANPSIPLTSWFFWSFMTLNLVLCVYFYQIRRKVFIKNK